MTIDKAELRAVADAKLRALAGDDKGANEIVELWLRTKAEVEEAMRPVLWREDEIGQAMERHPEQADLLWHANTILWPGPAFPYTEFIWRGHMRELLERVAAGEDTRPGTWAEMCLVCCEASALAPLTHAATGAYFRAWHNAFPANPVWEGLPEEVRHGMKWNDNEISEICRDVRGKIGRRMPHRRIARDLVCDGVHGPAGPARCRFIPGTLDGSHDPRPAPARRKKTAARKAPPAPGAEKLRADLLDKTATRTVDEMLADIQATLF